MKTLRILSAFFLLFVLGSCSDSGTSAEKTLNGEWKLTSVHGGITGAHYTFEPGVITWTFDTETNSLVVVNNNTDENKEDMLPSGPYQYSVEANTVTPEICAENFVIDDINFGCYDLGTNTLTFGQVEADGYLITLKR